MVNNLNILNTFKLQFSSVAQSRLTLCGPTDCSMPDLIIHYHLPEFTQTHVHHDAIQPSQPLSPPYPLASDIVGKKMKKN